MTRNRLLLSVGGAIIVVVAFGLWAKHDADSKAADFNKQHAAVAAAYKADVAKLNISVHTGPDYHATPAEAAAQQAICDTATALQKKVASLADLTTGSSVGGFMSNSYKHAQEQGNAAKTAAHKLQTYVNLCHYYVIETHRGAEQQAVMDSQEYQALLNKDSSTCSVATGCISAPNYAAFAPVYDRILAVDKKYTAQYEAATCPLAVNQKALCDAVLQNERANVSDTQKYINALNSGDKQQVSEAAKVTATHAAYDNLNATARKLDAGAKDIDAFFGRLFDGQEADLQKQNF